MEKKGKFQAFLDFLSKPAVAWGYNEKELEALGKMHNPTNITLVQNVIKVKDKETGKIISMDRDRYEVLDEN